MPHKSLGRSLAKIDAPIAREVGERIRTERLKAGLTQARLAEGRYTKAYISALEKGLAKPSLAALNFIAERLALPPAHFLRDSEPAWSRLEADLHLASGDWLKAADAYEALLERETHPIRRAEIGRALAEAWCRLERPADAVRVAGPAVAAFDAAGLPMEAARARYWLSSALYQAENDTEARSILQALLDQVRGGLKVEPDFETRLLISLAAIDGRGGQPKRSLTYLEEARGLVDALDDRRRAAFLVSLAIGYREGGDMEAAIGLANQAIARYRDLEADREIAVLENELALTHLALGATKRALAHALLAEERLVRLGDDRGRAHVIETRAQIALAAGDPAEAADLAAEALALAETTGNRKAAVSAGLTLGRARARGGDPIAAIAAFEGAATLAREHGRVSQLREILTEWADLRAAEGDAKGAFELSREALQLDAR